MLEDRVGPRKCLCGCGGEPKGRKAMFCMGHDMRLRGQLIREHLQGETVGEGVPAYERAERHGWQRFLREAEETRDRKQAEFVAKAKKNPRLQELGKAPDGSVVAFYQNANGSRDLEFVDVLGKKHWKHLPPKEAS